MKIKAGIESWGSWANKLSAEYFSHGCRVADMIHSLHQTIKNFPHTIPFHHSPNLCLNPAASDQNRTAHSR